VQQINFTNDNPHLHLLLEGVKEGQGELTLSIHKADGTLIGVGPTGIYMDLKDVRGMYVRKGGQAGGVPPYQQFPTFTGIPTSNYTYDKHEFKPIPDETDEVIIYVHGIHAPGMTNAETIKQDWYRNCETIYKRLWHQGYRGRFAAYKWDALNPAWPFKFNESECRAWHFGRGLKDFANEIPKSEKFLLAHSQGNIVAGSAIQDFGLSVSCYVMMNAAVSASCYDDTLPSNQPYNDWNNGTPDTYRGYLSNVPSNIFLANYYLANDSATAVHWVNNNRWAKPDLYKGYNKFSLSRNLGFQTRSVLHPYEQMGFTAKSRTHTAGVVGNFRGVKKSVDLSKYNFGSEDHSGHTQKTMMETYSLYRELCVDLTGR
jgi:hypothetical protein